MSILLLGLNHRTAPVDVRERLAFSREGVANALMLFRREYSDAEAAIISTCNRVELLINANDDSLESEQVVSFLARSRDLSPEAFRPHLYELTGRDAIRHVFRVISGLDSIVVGECQIVNQVKQAYAMAHEQGSIGPVLHRLFHHAFGVSKRARGETRIGDGKLSVPSVALDVVRKACPDPSDVSVMVVGAGDMAQHACQYLVGAGVRRLVVTSRTFQNARTLAAACGGVAAPYAELDRHLAAADVVITATSCPTPILTEERVRRAAAKREHDGSAPLLLIDLSVPRNVEPASARIPGVTLYDIDALAGVVADNHHSRTAAVTACEAIIDQELHAFERWIEQAKVGPIIDRIYRDVRELAEVEVRRLFNRCAGLSSDQREQVHQLVDRLVGKLLHPCVSAIRARGGTVTADDRVTSDDSLVSAFRAMRLNFAPDLTSAGSASGGGSAGRHAQ
jgi:glutamyl-tRNA reductase